MTPVRKLRLAWAGWLRLAVFAWMVGGWRVGAGEEVWWSLRSLVRPAVPEDVSGRRENPIDAFVQAELDCRGLKASPEASRRTLVRRLYFDLTGLPPSPEESDAFVADADPKAYEKLVDRLLASPQYGERWARHWLDVAHYGDTHGYDKDKPRPNAWPYRDYVIRVLNEDKPYSRFVREQLAGDVFWPGDPDGVEALGFISAGPWDFIGHAEVAESKTDGKVARHLDRDDMVANTMNTFDSLTVQCAQCHNHKFDPILSEDYYSLQAVFAAVDRTDVEYYRDPALNLQRAERKKRERDLDGERRALEQEIERQGGVELAELRGKAEAAKKAAEAHPPQYGYHSAIADDEKAIKWVQVDLGKSSEIRRVTLHPCWDDFAGIGEGFGFPRRFKVEVSDDPEFAARESVRVIHDQTGADFANPGLAPVSFPAEGMVGRYVRVTATRLAPRSSDFIFALAELTVETEGGNGAAGKEVSALDSIEAPERWRKSNLVDGIFPRGRADRSAIEKSVAEVIERLVDEKTRRRLETVARDLAAVRAELAAMPKPNLVYAGAVHYGSGAFRGTGPDGGKPRPIFLLARGDVKRPGKVVGPGALSAIHELPARFEIPEGGGEGERRKALALWLTDPKNPLTWRSIVNRVWQYHFGRGIVETANDFGRMGALPTHPALLDWLAVEFRDGGQSLKTLHKLIVTSATYRQISSEIPETRANAETDRENRFLWRMTRRKIEAEELRDAVLKVSGMLDPTLYGPPFQDFVVEKPEHSPHYEYALSDPDDPKILRRAIYRFIVRSQPQPFMAALDCADPSMLVDKRNESVSSLQALALLNNGFMVTMARHFAERARDDGGSLEEQVRRAFRLALSRQPSEREVGELRAYAESFGLENTCRLLFNLNEFIFLD